jgi:ketosteroid isomerase-like protein
MSRERPVETSTNLEVAAAFWEATERDLAASLPFLAADVELDFSAVQAVGAAEVYRGHDGVRRWFADWADMFEEYSATLLELTDAPPDHVVARVRARGLARGGVPVDTVGWQVASFRDGMIVRVESFSTEHAARAAAGLPG